MPMSVNVHSHAKRPPLHHHRRRSTSMAFVSYMSAFIGKSVDYSYVFIFFFFFDDDNDIK